MLSQMFSSPYATGVSSNPTTVCVASTCTVSFPFTGDYYTWTAPATLSYKLEVWGAQGGNAQYNGTVYLNGGAGGYAAGNYSATAGQVFNIYVGGQGTSSTNSLNDYLNGGFNGGGKGFNANVTTTRGSGGGGGSDIRVGGIALANRIIVAGGGGGNTYDPMYGTNSAGVGGGSSGTDGTTSGGFGSTYAGKAGTSSAGGAAGLNCGGFRGTDGTLGLGGAGETNVAMSSGGGGGGYFGGGGSGCQFAGGGGSGYVGGVTSTTLTAGNTTMPDPAGGTTTGRTGNGFARITYTWSTATISLAVTGGVKSVTKGQAIGVTATIDFAGKVTFFADGKKIPGCISVQASIGNKTCTWKPSTQKSVRLTARVDPSGASGATSAPVVVSVAKRTGTR